MDDICKVINYSDIFLSCRSNNTQRYLPMAKDHSLVYVLSGELEINEGGRITRLRKGECAFIRKDNRVSIRNDERFKAMWLLFPRNFLREF
jgi:glyoxylate utilization-related uncharacterized protein